MSHTCNSSTVSEIDHSLARLNMEKKVCIDVDSHLNRIKKSLFNNSLSKAKPYWSVFEFLQLKD